MSTGQGVIGYNMYGYCGNCPANKFDDNGEDAGAVATTWWTTMWWLTGIDSVLSIGDAIYALVGVVLLGAIAIERAITAPAITIPKAEVKEKEIPLPLNPDTVIYRWGSDTANNLTPKAKDLKTGLSFSTIPSLNCSATTIGAINATGVLYAVQDSPVHVGVRPVGATVADWVAQGENSIWTKAIRSVVVKLKGGIYRERY